MGTGFHPFPGSDLECGWTRALYDPVYPFLQFPPAMKQSKRQKRRGFCGHAFCSTT